MYLQISLIYKRDTSNWPSWSDSAEDAFRAQDAGEPSGFSPTLQAVGMRLKAAAIALAGQVGIVSNVGTCGVDVQSSTK